MKFVVLILLLFSTSGVFAATSAIRQNGESWEQARERNSSPKQHLHVSGNETVEGSARPLDQLDSQSVPQLASSQELNAIFVFMRDTKFIKNLQRPLNERRLSWLYPDDGCYLRAELATDYLSEQNIPEAAKIFVFGNLAVKTRNHPYGVVRWWFHVAPVYRLGNDVFVLDPAIEPTRPLLAREWQAAVSAESPVDKFSVCATHAMDPADNCLSPGRRTPQSLLDSQKVFLDLEWSRLNELGRNPQAELGDAPPWSRKN